MQRSGQRWEYHVIAAPRRGVKAKGAKTTADRFAVALAEVMNALGAEGWEYLRADTLPVDERSGLTGTATNYQNMLVFRRPKPDEALVQPVAALAPPHRVEPAPPAPSAAVTDRHPPVLDQTGTAKNGNPSDGHDGGSSDSGADSGS